MNLLKLFRRKKEDKEVIVDEQGNEVEIEDEVVEPKEEPAVEETKVEETTEEPKEEMQPEEVATETVSEEPVAEEIKEVESDEVKSLKLELETIKAELEALKKAQIVEPEPQVEDKTYEEFGLQYDPHFTDGSETNKKPRF